MGEKPFQAAHISQIDGRLVDGGPQARRPVREYFDIGAFGVNAFTVAEAGEGLVEAHDELSGMAWPPYPGNAGVLYNMACVESLEGDKGAALGHLREALTGDPESVPGWAADDPDLDPIRTADGFPF